MAPWSLPNTVCSENQNKKKVTNESHRATNQLSQPEVNNNNKKTLIFLLLGI